MTPSSRRQLVVPLVALAFQAVPPLLLWALSTAAFGESPWLSDEWERPVSLVVLGACAVVSLLLGGVGTYRLLRWSRPWVAVVLIGVCCVPALLGGAVYLHALLVYLTVA
jgi:hypothetical protein